MLEICLNITVLCGTFSDALGDMSNYFIVHRDMFDQGDQDQDMPHAVSVTPAEEEAIERVWKLLKPLFYFYLVSALISLCDYCGLVVYNDQINIISRWSPWDLTELKLLRPF